MPVSARWAWCGLALVAFAALHFSSWSTPGVYMDAVNPDYMVVRLLYGDRNFPIWIIPGNLAFGVLPVLVQVYHGALPYYVGLPAYALFGTDLFGIRVAAALFGLLSLVAMGAYLRSLRIGWGLALILLLCLATDPAFILNFRTQFYITALPAALLLVSLALLRADEAPLRIGLAGLLAGIAIYGYFIYAFPAALLTLLVLVGRLPGRAKLAWMAGLALGLSLFALGYLLVLLQAGSVSAFIETMQALVRGQAPTQSGLDLAGRFGKTLQLARLGLDNGGNTAMALGGAIRPRLAGLRWVMLGIAGAGLAWAIVARPGLRRSALGVLACAAGFLALGLVFGDRLWAHHYSSMPIWFVTAFAIAMALLWRLPRIGPVVVTVLGVGLIASNLLTWRVTVRELELTGGRNLFSDAIVRFAESAAQDARRPTVVTPDWGVMMPLAMLAQGAVPVVDGMDPAAVRGRLCAGQDVTVALLVARGLDRLPAWETTIGWGRPLQRSFAQRDGVPVLVAATWRAADRPEPSPCGS